MSKKEWLAFNKKEKGFVYIFLFGKLSFKYKPLNFPIHKFIDE